MHRLSALVGLLFLGCGGSEPSAEAPADEAPASAPLGEAQQCLADAQAVRDPNPHAPEVIDVVHILVRHRELRDPHGATRTREEACLRALEALHALQASGDWDAEVLKYSDADNDVLGRVRADDLATDFANAAFALEPNELSYVVETSRGFHIILRRQ